ncbi:NAD(P)H-dependent flavin oxidoreductase [Alkanindiges sp. WGS2144]|uniref:NAD(P)H-dependent flavin oxidoreductase n=1 Tax=Alkanindiges sp. WGS2144 TaxID=3366808 RepID=UPI003750D5F7
MLQPAENFLKKIGVTQPIFLAPMAGTSTPELAAAVSNAGGLGSLGLATSSVEQARQAIQHTRQLTDKPFNCNFFCHQPPIRDPETERAWIDYIAPFFQQFGATPPQELKSVNSTFIDDQAMLDMLLAEKPAVVSFHFGVPKASVIEQLKQAGIVLMASATSLPEAQIIAEAGLDAIIAQGVEAGGHRGIFNRAYDPAISTHDLVCLFKAHVDLPIIAAGGLMNGQDIKNVLQLGACAGQLGTAFVICPESAASSTYRERLLNPDYQITQITDSISGRPARGLINAWHQYIDRPERPVLTSYSYTYDLAKQLSKLAIQHGNYDFAAFWAGSNVSRIRNIDASHLMQTLIAELA